jgi:hypothetical protein
VSLDGGITHEGNKKKKIVRKEENRSVSLIKQFLEALFFGICCCPVFHSRLSGVLLLIQRKEKDSN